MPSKKKLYKITFSNQGKLYELYAKEVSNSNLLGFIEIESLVFGEKTSLVVDPSEEKIKTEFEETAFSLALENELLQKKNIKFLE